MKKLILFFIATSLSMSCAFNASALAKKTGPVCFSSLLPSQIFISINKATPVMLTSWKAQLTEGDKVDVYCCTKPKFHSDCADNLKLMESYQVSDSKKEGVKTLLFHSELKAYVNTCSGELEIVDPEATICK